MSNYVCSFLQQEHIKGGRLTMDLLAITIKINR